MLIGGGDWSEHRIIPDLVRAFSANQPLEVRNPNAVRPWQHVLDPLDGYLLLGQKLMEAPQRHSTAYNFGPDPNDRLTVRELVEIGAEQWGSGSFESPEQTNAPHEAGLLTLDIEKAGAELDWAPRFDSRQAIAETIGWYRDFATDPTQTTLKQIASFYQQPRRNR